MPQNFNPDGKRTGIPSGFTLVDVVLALAMIAFAFTAVFGLVGLALQETRKADLYNRLASIHERVSSMYQSQYFTSASSVLSSKTTLFFDYSGTPVGTGSGTATSGTYFRCVLMPVATSSSNIVIEQVKIDWPCPQYTSTDSSIFSILNYR